MKVILGGKVGVSGGVDVFRVWMKVISGDI